jgi:membrane fusion protein, multidrug efflux system
MKPIRKLFERTPRDPNRKPTTKRMIIMLIAVGILLGGIVGFNFIKGYMMAKFMASQPTPPATVTATKVDYQEWQSALNVVGTLRAVRGVDVTSEVAGLVRSVDFRSGDEVRAGAVLAQLNADSDIAQLHALEAAAELAQTVYDRDKAQLDAQAISKAQVDADAADLKNKRALVAQQQALIDKKTIRAPFGGRLGITTVNPGQYLNPGDKLVTLQAIDPIYIDFYVPQQQLPLVALGQKVMLEADAYKGQPFEGKVNAINPKVDSATRNVQMEAIVPNPKKLLLPGMFASVSVIAGGEQRYLTLPQTAITFNPYGDTVFVAKAAPPKDAQGNAPKDIKGTAPKDAKGEKAKDEKGAPSLVAQQVFVTTGPRRGDQIAILKGIEPGESVVTSGTVKLKNGTPLIVDNRVQPANSPNPAPQEK